MAAAGAATHCETRLTAPAPLCAAPAAEGKASQHHLRRPPWIVAKGQRGLRVLRRGRTAVAAASLGQPSENQQRKVGLLQRTVIVGATALGAVAVGSLLHEGPRPAVQGHWDTPGHGLLPFPAARVVPHEEAPAGPQVPDAAPSPHGGRSRCQPKGWTMERGGAALAFHRGSPAGPPMGPSVTIVGDRHRASPSAAQAHEATRLNHPWELAYHLAYPRGAGAMVEWKAVRHVPPGRPVQHAVDWVDRGGLPARHGCRAKIHGLLDACPPLTDRHLHHPVTRLGGDRRLAAAVAHLPRAAVPPHRGVGRYRLLPPADQPQRIQAYRAAGGGGPLRRRGGTQSSTFGQKRPPLRDR